MEAPKRRTEEEILRELHELSQQPGDPSPIGARQCYCTEIGAMWRSITKAPFASVVTIRNEFPGLAKALDTLAERDT